MLIRTRPAQSVSRTTGTPASKAQQAQQALQRSYQRAWAQSRFNGCTDISTLADTLARDGLTEQWGTGWAWDVLQDVWAAHTHPKELLHTLVHQASHPAGSYRSSVRAA